MKRKLEAVALSHALHSIVSTIHFINFYIVRFRRRPPSLGILQRKHMWGDNSPIHCAVELSPGTAQRFRIKSYVPHATGSADRWSF